MLSRPTPRPAASPLSGNARLPNPSPAFSAMLSRHAHTQNGLVSLAVSGLDSQSSAKSLSPMPAPRRLPLPVRAPTSASLGSAQGLSLSALSTSSFSAPRVSPPASQHTLALAPLSAGSGSANGKQDSAREHNTHHVKTERGRESAPVSSENTMIEARAASAALALIQSATAAFGAPVRSPPTSTHSLMHTQLALDSLSVPASLSSASVSVSNAHTVNDDADDEDMHDSYYFPMLKNRPKKVSKKAKLVNRGKAKRRPASVSASVAGLDDGIVLKTENGHTDARGQTHAGGGSVSLPQSSDLSLSEGVGHTDGSTERDGERGPMETQRESMDDETGENIVDPEKGAAAMSIWKLRANMKDLIQRPTWECPNNCGQVCVCVCVCVSTSVCLWFLVCFVVVSNFSFTQKYRRSSARSIVRHMEICGAQHDQTQTQGQTDGQTHAQADGQTAGQHNTNANANTHANGAFSEEYERAGGAGARKRKIESAQMDGAKGTAQKKSVDGKVRRNSDFFFVSVFCVFVCS